MNGRSETRKRGDELQYRTVDYDNSLKFSCKLFLKLLIYPSSFHEAHLGGKLRQYTPAFDRPRPASN